MRRLRLAIRAVDWAGFDGCERELSTSIGGNATETEEWNCIILRAGVFGVMIAAIGVGLPNFQNGVGDRLAVAIEHAAVNHKAFAHASFGEIGAVQTVEANAEEGAHGLRRRRGAGHFSAPWAWHCARAERYQTGSPAIGRARCSASRMMRSSAVARLRRERCERWDRIRAMDRREN